MKKSLFIICIATVLATASFSCKKTLSAIFGGVDADAPSVPVTLPPIPLIATGTEYNVGTVTSSFNLDSVIRANTAGVFGINAVSSIKVKQVKITNSDGNTLNNLSNLESFRIEMMSNTNNTYISFINATFPTTETYTYTYTPTTDIELLSYLKGTTVTYNIYGKARKPTTQNLTLSVVVTLHVQ